MPSSKRLLAFSADFCENNCEVQMATITLLPEIEAPLADAARKRGMTPESLAVETLRQNFPPSEPDRATTLYDYLAGYIGAVEGTGESLSENCGEKFTDWLVEKRKAGRLRNP
jgi:hypothetical protein